MLDVGQLGSDRRELDQSVVLLEYSLFHKRVQSLLEVRWKEIFLLRFVQIEGAYFEFKVFFGHIVNVLNCIMLNVK